MALSWIGKYIYMFSKGWENILKFSCQISCGKVMIRCYSRMHSLIFVIQGNQAA